MRYQLDVVQFVQVDVYRSHFCIRKMYGLGLQADGFAVEDFIAGYRRTSRQMSI